MIPTIIDVILLKGSSMKRRCHPFRFLLWVIATASPAHAAEVYQWCDSTGGIHFTDDYYATPVALRGTPDLIVRNDLRSEERFVNAKTVSATPIQERWAATT